MSLRSLFAPIAIATVLAAGSLPAAHAQDEPIESIPATITAMFGNWYELSQLDIEALDPATAEMVIHRSTLPQTDANAAGHYFRAVLTLPRGKAEIGDLINEGIEDPLADRIAEMRAGKYDEVVASLSGSEQSLRAALVSGYCDWSPATEAGINTLLPELSPMRLMTKSRLLLATWHLSQERPWSALQCYRDLLSMARDTGQGPYLISALVGISMESLTLKHIESAVPVMLEQGIPADCLARIISRRYRTGANPITAISSERYWMASFGVMDSTSFSSALAFWEMAAKYSAFVQYVDGTHVLNGAEMRQQAIKSEFVTEAQADDINELVRLVMGELQYINTYYDKMINAWTLPNDEFEQFNEQLKQKLTDDRQAHPLGFVMLPAIGRARSSMLAIERNRNALNLALAAAAERQARHRWPMDIDELRVWRPDLNTIDPVSSSNYGLKASGDSVAVSWTLTPQEAERTFPKTQVKVVVPGSN